MLGWIDLIFIFFIFTIVVFAITINVSEDKLPSILVQTFRFGKHAYKGTPSRLVQACELPKSYFKHFYVFAIIWALLIFGLTFNVYVLGGSVPLWIIDALDTLFGTNRVVTASSFTTFQAVTLLTLQCVRRFYETHYIQIFSSKVKINITHYIVGYLHYVGAFLAILSQAPGFVHNPQPEDVTYFHVDSVLPRNLSMTIIFVVGWYQQFRANIMLANLRKNRKGVVVTEKHIMPEEGFFEFVSSPHMFFEVLIYFSLTVLLISNFSWWLVFIWVVVNQIENAWLTHKWYLQTFSNYPKERRAIFPGFL